MILYTHGGSKNHGCEAILRSTCKIMKNCARPILYSYDAVADHLYGIDKICTVNTHGVCHDKHSFIWMIISILNKFKINCWHIKYYKLFHEKKQLALSIGGDNYCYGTFPTELAYLNRVLNKANCRTVLWGCSIEPELLNDKRIVKDLNRYSLITARESITYDALLNAGINKNTKLYPDPAFQLDKIDPKLSDDFSERNIVGINVSPLIMKYERNKNITWENYRQLIRYILQTTEMQIALIPHVVQLGNDDRIPLQVLYDEFKESGRVVMIEDHNCMELKGYISHLRMFICARTHASIAAYSTCVPTLVTGYSVKANGIAKDIFGTCEHYVVPVQSLQKNDELVSAFQWLTGHENVIRGYLREFMPSYCAKAQNAGQEIKRLIGENY